MKRVAGVLLVALCLLASRGAAALELGDIEVGSLQGEALMARIPLTGLAAGVVPEGLKVGLGTAEDFARAQLERSAHLDSLEFIVVADAREPAHIMIRGREPVDASFLTLLVEARWPEGRVLREYIVLLDSAPVSRSRSYGPVRATDTLWSLAERHRPEGISVQRMMLAMLAANPHAFAIENVNALRAGVMLEIPEIGGGASGEREAAIQEVERQNAAWRLSFESLRAADFPPEAAPTPSADDDGASAAAMPGGDLPDAEAEPEPDASPGAAAESPEAGEAPATGSQAVPPESGAAPEGGTVPEGGAALESGTGEALRAELDRALEEADERQRQVQALTARLDEADRLIEDLQRQVALKDDDIAGLERRLAEEAETLAQVRAEARAQAEAAAEARREAEAQAALAAQVQAQAQDMTQSESAAPASILPVESPEAEQGGDMVDAPESGPEVAGDAGVAEDESAGSAQQDGPEGAPPSLLQSLESLLGFSPIVGGVGLVGLILIVGGLIALMRRRSAEHEYAEEEDLSEEDDTLDEAWEDEETLGEDEEDPREHDAPAADAEGEGESTREAAAHEPDLGIEPNLGLEPDEDLTRAFDEEFGADIDFEPEGRAPEQRSSPGPRSEQERPSPDDGAGDAASADGSYPELDEAGRDGDPAGRGAFPRDWEDEDAFDEANAVFVPEEGLAGEIDEFQTKLDLAQTYIDMEDFDNARALLHEVRTGGSVEQRAIARYLGGKMP